MEIKPFEQRLAPLEQAAQGVEQQALAEAPGTRKEVVLVLLDQALDHRGLVDVVVAPVDDLGEGLNPNGQAFLPGGGHGNLLSESSMGLSLGLRIAHGALRAAGYGGSSGRAGKVRRRPIRRVMAGECRSPRSRMPFQQKSA